MHTQSVQMVCAYSYAQGVGINVSKSHFICSKPCWFCWFLTLLHVSPIWHCIYLIVGCHTPRMMWSACSGPGAVSTPTIGKWHVCSPEILLIFGIQFSSIGAKTIPGLVPCLLQQLGSDMYVVPKFYLSLVFSSVALVLKQYRAWCRVYSNNWEVTCM